MRARNDAVKLSHYPESAGHDLLPVRSPHLALRLLRRQRADVVLARGELSVMPPFLQHEDRDYSSFSATVLIEQRNRWRSLRGEALYQDQWWAGVCELRDDGAARIVPLTLERIETYAALYSVRHASESFSIEPGGTL